MNNRNINITDITDISNINYIANPYNTAKIYAIKNDYPIIVETKRGNLWYLKGYGCDRKKLQELINHQIKQKYRPESNLYFINK